MLSDSEKSGYRLLALEATNQAKRLERVLQDTPAPPWSADLEERARTAARTLHFASAGILRLLEEQ
jgi:hypothetical protein